MKRTDPGKIQQDIFSAAAKVQKKADGGLSWVAKGPANVATRVDTSTPVMFFNSSTTVAYVSFATTSTGIRFQVDKPSFITQAPIAIISHQPRPYSLISLKPSSSVLELLTYL
jgi:hypothetical protein